MTEAYREQHPLLNEDFSEEEHFSPHRRFRPMAFRSRVRNKVKGAASIIRRWPGFWSSALIYWWVGLGMILITTLLIYNGLTITALLSMETNTAPMIRIDDVRQQVKQTSYLPEVFMHVFFNIGEEKDYTKYIPHIKTISNQYKDYIYHLVIVVNDTTVDHVVTAEENNEIALNSLLDDSDIYVQKNLNGILIEQISLVKYLDRSPLRKHWRHIPSQFIEFLVRAISIWDKGGIALNPITLTPHSHSYKKMQKVLEKYTRNSDAKDEEDYVKKVNNTKNNQKQRLNNIRDIINAMEQVDKIKDDVAENENKDLLEPAESRFLGPIILNILNDTKIVIDKLSRSLRQNKKEENIKNNENEGHIESENNMTATQKDINNKNLKKNSEIKDSNRNFLPNILKYLLDEKNIDIKPKPEKIESILPLTNSTRKRKSVINANSLDRNSIIENKEISSNNDEMLHNEYVVNYMPMIVPANKTNGEKLIKKYNSYNVIHNSNRSIDTLTIGLNGNILATATSCHAFIGTLFNNVHHHGSEETLTNFIIDELSLFCNGLLSSCGGIDVILL